MRSIFVLHLVVGVLKIQKMKDGGKIQETRGELAQERQNTPQKLSRNNPLRQSAETLEGWRIQGAKEDEVKSVVQNRGSRQNYSGKPSQGQISKNSSRNTSKSPPRNTSADKSVTITRKRSQEAGLVVTAQSQRSSGPGKTARSDQRVVKRYAGTTQFTDAELNRIIESVGGGYLLSSVAPSSKYATSNSAALKELESHMNTKISYMGFDRLVNKTKRFRENLKISNLLS